MMYKEITYDCNNGYIGIWGLEYQNIHSIVINLGSFIVSGSRSLGSS